MRQVVAPAPGGAYGFDGRNLLTIDVEDYFHANGLRVPPGRWEQMPGRVEYATRRLLRILDRHDVRATFFVLGWIAERHPELVREIHVAGHEIASHGFGHRLVYDQDRATFRRDVIRAREILRGITGEPVDGYRAPSFSIAAESRWAHEVLVETGHRYDSSVFPVRRKRYGDPHARRDIHWLRPLGPGRAGLLEVPPSSVRVAGRNVGIAGGGYLRFFPLAVTRQAIRHLNEREDRPAVIYLHPWEIDPDQPRLPAALADRWRHYLNLDRTEERLRALLEEFTFVPARDLLQRYLPQRRARVVAGGAA